MTINKGYKYLKNNKKNSKLLYVIYNKNKNKTFKLGFNNL
jgi:hypothetical protein